MRRIAVITIVLALLGVALPAQALAHRVERGTDTQTLVECFDLASAAGSAAFIAGVSDEFGGFAQVAFWAPGSEPFIDPPTWVGSSFDASVSADGASLTASVEMFAFSETDPEGELIGTATIDADLAPLGDPEPFRITEDGGNQQFVIEGVRQALTVSGTLSLPEEISFEIAGCEAATETATRFITNPDARVMHAQQVQLNCIWETDGAFVNLFAITDQFGSFADLFVTDATGDYAGFGEVTLTSGAFAAALDLVLLDEEMGEEVVGSMTASATLSATGERINDRFGFDHGKVHIVGTELAVAGSLELSLPSGDATYVMDATSCSAADLRVSQIETTQNGPKPKPLANDLPENAEPIAIGDAVSVRTGGTAVEPEAPCLFEDPESGESFELPFGHTAWWSLEGTGDAVTIDTAGSSFDTVLAVYVEGAAGLEQVACVDDVDTLQAVVTIATEAGTTYLVQAGGFGESAGVLELRVD